MSCNIKHPISSFKHRLLVTTALFLAGASIAAVAKQNLYLEANVGYASVANQLNEKNGSPSMRLGAGGSVNAGWMLNQYVGVEAGGAMISNNYFFSGITGDSTFVSPEYVDNPNYYADVALKGVLPLSSRFNAFAKVGVASVHQKMTQFVTVSGQTKVLGDRNGLALFYGAGVGYRPTPDFQLNLQSAFTNGSSASLPSSTALSRTMLVSLGFDFFFNL